MKTKTKRRPQVNIITLGCAKNTVDSEVLLTQLRGNGVDAAHESNEHHSNIVIINSCGFIEAAKQESVDTILKYVEAKRQGVVEKVYVTGCLSQRYKDNLAQEIPEVDAWFGTRDLHRLLQLFNADYKHELVGERILTNPTHFAYLKISEGCNRTCSFCAIPLVRGRHISKPLEQLVLEAKKLAQRGTKELLLIAQDSTYYGVDLYRKRALAELLTQLAAIEPVEWIRLHYAFPTGFPLDILTVMANHSNICNYLDIPLQHGADRMLHRMKRGSTREKTMQLLNVIRDRVPGIAIRTTLMVGHPGETEEDFDEMMCFVEQARFERLGVFVYSHEENTTSYTMKDDVPDTVKLQRQQQLMRLQQKISTDINRKKIGKTFKTIIDREEGGYFVGRTEFDSPEVDNEVIIDASQVNLRPGNFAKIKIHDATEFDLMGTPTQV